MPTHYPPAYDAHDDPPHPVLDRVFPVHECVPVPAGAIYLNSGGHAYSTHGTAGPIQGFYVPHLDGAALL
jgi:hypothetical protein